MNRRQSVTHKVAIQAFLDGKEIQWSHDGDSWKDTDNPIWGLSYQYRAKPEPIIVWAIVNTNAAIISTHNSRAAARCRCSFNCHVVKLVQDLG